MLAPRFLNWMFTGRTGERRHLRRVASLPKLRAVGSRLSGSARRGCQRALTGSGIN